MRKALVIGMGVSGCAARDHLVRRGWEVTAVDRNAREGILSDQTPLDPSAFDLTILSPGVSPDHPLLQGAQEVIGEVELALRSWKGKTIGITGTNGKTTVTLLVAHLLNEAGIGAVAAGNVGDALSSVVDRVTSDTLLVVELSSYQLETLNVPCFDAAAILNLSPDHLDRYGSMEAYAAAKWRIATLLRGDEWLFVPPQLARRGCTTFGFDSTSDIRIEENHLIRFEKIETFPPVEYRGVCNHHVHNWLAAYALCRTFGVGPDAIHKGFASFSRPPHRMEVVRTLRGVTWVNDSKGTNLEAVEVAVSSLPGPVRLIAGGRDKANDFSQWIRPFEGRVEEIYAIGEAEVALQKALGDHYQVHQVETLEAAVAGASEAAQAGDWVLLSPGCASFDQFPNFEKRGECFKELVGALE